MKGFDKLKYRVFSADTSYDWKCLEEEIPEDPYREYLFYNDHTGEYVVSNFHDIEEEYKSYRADLGKELDFLRERFHELDKEYKPGVYYIDKMHSYTHFSQLPLPPKSRVDN